MDIRKDFFPGEIAEALIYYSDHDQKETVQASDALYDLMAICENEYNNEYYRIVWDILQDLTHIYVEEEAIGLFRKQYPFEVTGIKRFKEGAWV